MLNTQDLEIHAIAELFPSMSGEEFEALVEDIAKNGLIEPLWTYQGKVIDGRNRFHACKRLGIEPATREWNGIGSLIEFVLSLNLNRRHLSSSQKALLAVDIEPMLAEEAKKRQYAGVALTENVPAGEARSQAAVIAGTNGHYVTDAKRICADAPELKPLIKNGHLTIPDAKILASLAEEERVKALEKLAKKEAKNVKSAVLEVKKEAQEENICVLADKPVITLASCQDWLIDKPQCDLLLTDPPYSTDVEYFDEFVQSWLPLALSKVKSTGRAYICIGAYPHELQTYLNSIVLPDLPLQQILIWTYNNTLGPVPRYDYKQNYQAILYYRGIYAAPLDCPLMTEQFSSQTINAPDGRHGSRYHAWQKPDELAERIIRHSSKPGDVVYDLFSGTGTFLLAAKKFGREALGCEISSDMAKIAEKRGCAIVS